MKHLTKLTTIFYFIFICFNPLIADEKTAVIDIDFLIQNSNIGKRILKNINKLNNKNIELLEKKNKDLRKVETDIKNKKNILSSEDFDKEVKSFQQNLKNFTVEKDNIVKEFNDFRSAELEKLFKLFNPLITNYMKENSVNILLDTKNIFMINKDANITEDILEIINNEIK